jgi:hypothetical protein
LKASTQWDTISNDDDLIGMLRLVQTSMFTVATSKNGMHSLITDDWKKLGRWLPSIFAQHGQSKLHPRGQRYMGNQVVD